MNDMVLFAIPYVGGVLTGALIVSWLWFCRDVDMAIDALKKHIERKNKQ